ncbi:MAG: hypothetical protein JXB49_36580, partial [Bacteroidales bacterium]|nr:hypothetical protein [Bacteroidales bacterium]
LCAWGAFLFFCHLIGMLSRFAGVVTLRLNSTNKHWPVFHCYNFSKYTKFLFHVIYYLMKRLAGLGLFDVMGWAFFIFNRLPDYKKSIFVWDGSYRVLGREGFEGSSRFWIV